MRGAGGVSVALLVLGAGCSGSSPGPAGKTGSLDCAWLDGDNCLKANLLDAMSCVAPASESGVLGADNASCSYASGVTITFDAPLQLPLPTDAPPPWHFTITRAGTACLRFESTDSANFKLVVNGNAVTQTLARPLGTVVTVSCPDGVTYSSANALSLPACTVGLPAEGWGSGDANVSLELYLYGFTTSPLRLFDCAR
jgi:hypothetical protein